MKKTAVLISDSKEPVDFYITDASGEVIYNGRSVPFGYDEDSGDNVHTLDFSDIDTPGTYEIHSGDGSLSRAFGIGASRVYSSMLYDSLNYFYQNRSAINIESGYI